MFHYEDLPAGLSYDATNSTIYGTIDHDLVTPQDNIRDFYVRLTVTDLVTDDTQTLYFQRRVETDPYPAYE
ncbi:MAG: hypothetical protein RMI91_06525 [Gemmatales bacterium]|nr:hypothetical protein [Gemmatales bacterium]MDW7994291.1 hypothetical protein [Gemmatales bacterium]